MFCCFANSTIPEQNKRLLVLKNIGHHSDSFAGYIPSFLASNIKVMDWLPQNDLLAHKDIKAFVSHVGHNSLYESAYHGVPVVGFPLFAEQHSNTRKAEHFGFGSGVDRKTTDAQQLYEAIELVISEPRYFLLSFFSFCQ